MKKILITLAIIAMFVGVFPIAHGQTVDQSSMTCPMTSQQDLINCLLRQLIGKLLERVQELEAQLALKMQTTTVDSTTALTPMILATSTDNSTTPSTTVTSTPSTQDLLNQLNQATSLATSPSPSQSTPSAQVTQIGQSQSVILTPGTNWNVVLGLFSVTNNYSLPVNISLIFDITAPINTFANIEVVPNNGQDCIGKIPLNNRVITQLDCIGAKLPANGTVTFEIDATASGYATGTFSSPVTLKDIQLKNGSSIPVSGSVNGPDITITSE